MRKVGFSALLSGLVLSALLYLIRQTDWFHAELSRGMSDFAELVESSFWAALVLTAFGVFLLLQYQHHHRCCKQNRKYNYYIYHYVNMLQILNSL